MDDLERQLREAMSRKDAPAWFEARVLAAVDRQPRRSWPFRRLSWAAAAFASVLMVGGVAWQQERNMRDRIAGERAKAQLELALKITGEKLHHIQAELDALQTGN